eukprot:1024260-Amphidinium_carterae.1
MALSPWRQLHLHFAGGHRAQQFSLLCTITPPTKVPLGMATQSSSRNSTTNGWKTLEDTRQRMVPTQHYFRSREDCDDSQQFEGSN